MCLGPMVAVSQGFLLDTPDLYVNVVVVAIERCVLFNREFQCVQCEFRREFPASGVGTTRFDVNFTRKGGTVPGSTVVNERHLKLKCKNWHWVRAAQRLERKRFQRTFASAASFPRYRSSEWYRQDISLQDKHSENSSTAWLRSTGRWKVTVIWFVR